jgi:hypothetical protein
VRNFIRLPRVMKHYSPTDGRNHGRPSKRHVRPKRVNKWPISMADIWWWWWWWEILYSCFEVILDRTSTVWRPHEVEAFCLIAITIEQSNVDMWFFLFGQRGMNISDNVLRNNVLKATNMTGAQFRVHIWRIQPPLGQGLLIHEVSLLHTTTHHSR